MDNKKTNFKRISENRVNKILIVLQQLGNLTNSSFYEYSNEEIEDMFNSIQSELDKTKDKLIRNNKYNKKIEL